MIGSRTTPAWLPASDQVLLPLASAHEVWQQIRRHSRGLRHWLVSAMAVTVVAAVLDLMPSVITGRIIDAVRNGAGISDLVLPSVTIVAAGLGASLLGGLGQSLTPSFFTSVVARLREDMLNQAFKLNQLVLERAGTADLVSRAGDDVASVRDAANGVLPRLANTGTLVIVSSAGAAAMHPLFLVPMALGAAIYIWAIHRFLAAAPPIYQAERQASAAQSQEVLSTLHGLDAVHAFAIEDNRLKKVSTASWKAVRLGLQGRFLANDLSVRLILGEIAIVLSSIGMGVVLTQTGWATIGQASAALLMLLRIFGPLRFLLLFLDGLQSAFVSLQRIVGVQLISDPATGTAQRVRLCHTDEPDIEKLAAGSMEAQSVCFSYRPGHLALRDVSLRIEPGEHIALVGESGAGKTTLALLLAGLLPPDSGHISVGTDPFRLGPTTVLVSQDIHTFSGTLRENLALGLPDGIVIDDRDELLWNVLDTVQASSWVRALPEGLDTPVGRLGMRILPAQAQQIALGRVLLADPPIVILDEATAEAGSAGADCLDAAARAVTLNRTSLIVAHRLSQVLMADRTAVMSAGRIIELGTPDELLVSGGSFSQLWRTWQGPRHNTQETAQYLEKQPEKTE